MKLIENTIEAVNLEASTSNENLEENMASCVSVKLNGESPEESNSVKKLEIEEVLETNKLTNGIREKLDSQSKSNGDMNGICDDASYEEFTLELDSSSDDGSSPSKKNDDTLSTPFSSVQIVQEIEDLLGINANSVGIDDEIEKELSRAESPELSDKYDEGSVNSEIENTPQEIKDVFGDEEDVSDTIDSSSSNDGRIETNKPPSKTTECDSSSVSNLVFDEIEIGTLDSVDSQDETTTVKKLPEDSVDDTLKTPEEDGTQLSEVESTTENIVDDTKAKNSNISEENNKIEDEYLMCNKAMDIETNEKIDLDCDIHNASSLDVNLEVKSGCRAETSVKDMDVDSKNQSKTNTTVAYSSTSDFGAEAVRKRTSSIDEEQAESKKPKLDNKEEKRPQLLNKRRTSDPVEAEVKRTKLSDFVLGAKPLVDPSAEATLTVESRLVEDAESATPDIGVKDKEHSVISTTQSSGQHTDCQSAREDMQLDETDSFPTKRAESSNNTSKLPQGESLSSVGEVSTSDKRVGKSISDCKGNIDVSSSISTGSGNDKSCVLLDDDSVDINKTKDTCLLSTGSQTKSNEFIEEHDKEVKVNSKPDQLNKDMKPKPVPNSSNEIENSAKKTEKSKPVISKSPFNLLSKNMEQTKSVNKEVSNSEITVEKGKSGADRILPVLKKFHKNQLKKLTRSDLEEIVVMKICEAITDRSDLGQMRLRCQALEQNNELWRKKAAQFEKQNRELEMVLKRFLAEAALNKRENQNKLIVPIKVTRSVGLQVVLASAVPGAHKVSSEQLESVSRSTSASRSTSSSRSTSASRSASGQSSPSRQQPASTKPKSSETDQDKTTTFTPPVQPVSVPRRGRPACKSQSSSPVPPSPQPSPTKVSPPTTPLKPIAPKMSAPNKDLEVIDLTDKEEKTKVPAGGSIRVSPATQMCFIQPNATNSQPPPMAYYLQKPGQRPQQYLVTTTSASPPKAGGSVTQRSATAVAVPVPVFRNGQIIPVQTSPQVAVRATTSTPTPTIRQVPQAIRLQSQVALKHPAPLPSAPAMQSKPGFKAPPPKPQLKIAKTVNGIMLSWSMMLTKDMADMASYQLYAYQEGQQAPTTSLWKKVGDVKALPLPMACTLTQFIEGHRYHFAVRAVDIHGRVGPFSLPSTIMLTK